MAEVYERRGSGDGWAREREREGRPYVGRRFDEAEFARRTEEEEIERRHGWRARERERGGFEGGREAETYGPTGGYAETRGAGYARAREYPSFRREKRGWTKEGPLVRDVMTRNPRVVGPDGTVAEAARAMREEDAGILPVIRDGHLAGVITDRDLVIRVFAEGRDPATVRIGQVMTEDLHVCSPDDRLVEAVRMMGEEQVRRLPVVDRDDRLRGMLSMTDVAREAELDYALQEALERIASRRSFWSRW